MPTLAALLKEEISKIVRKEVQHQMREQRDAILARLEKQTAPAKAQPKAAPKPKAAKAPKAKPAAKAAKAPAAPADTAASDDGAKQIRISPAIIRKHRKRLKLSQAELAKLLNVSTNTVLRWEAGSSKPRSQHLPQLDQLRSMSQRDLKKQLGE